MPAGISAGAIAAGVSAAGTLASTASQLASGGSSSTPAGSITTSGTNRPFSADYSLPGLNRASWLFDQPNAVQTFSGVGAPLSQDTQDWMNRMRAIASMPNNGAVTAGNGFLNNLIGGNFTSAMPGFQTLADTSAGKYLPGQATVSTAPGGGSITAGGTGNPFLDSLISQAANKAQASVNSSFAGNERFGSGANANALTSNVMDATAGILSPIYESERNRQLQAAGILSGDQLQATGMAPSLEAAQFTVPMMQASALQGIGQFQDKRAQDEQDANMLALQHYLALTSGTPTGSSTTNSQPYWQNPWSAMLGSALSGGGVGGLGKNLQTAWNGAKSWFDTTPSDQTTASMPFTSPAGTI